MFCLINQNKSWLWALCLLGLLNPSALAHQIHTAEDVGVTLHIQPQDQPRAGEQTDIWFALTRPGGKVISLNMCNCQLVVKEQPIKTGVLPLEKPILKAVNAEGYQDIPGTKIVFPKPGAYQLQLTGKPKTGANFKPFDLKFDVTVATGISLPIATPTAIPIKSNQKIPILPISIAMIISGSTIGLVWYKIKKKLK